MSWLKGVPGLINQISIAGDNVGKRNNKNCKNTKKAVPQKEPAGRRKKFEERVKKYTKDYTNERICSQIRNDCVLFGVINVLLAVSFALILSSFIRTFLDIHTELQGAFGDFKFFWNELRENHPVGLIFGITFLIVSWVGIQESGWINMFRHLRPACSGRRYKAKEIDALVNHPDTIWLDSIRVFAAPDALIGIDRGIAVAEYGDITGVRVKAKHNSKRTTNRYHHGRVGFFTALYYAATDQYREWDTYLIIIKTKKHRRMVLTESSFKDGDSLLLPIIEEKKKQI